MGLRIGSCFLLIADKMRNELFPPFSLSFSFQSPNMQHTFYHHSSLPKSPHTSRVYRAP